MVRMPDIVDQAIDWHLRLPEASAEDWHVFVAWLEADEANRDAYDRITMDDALLSAAPDQIEYPLHDLPIAANDTGPTRRIARWSFAGGGLIAAALVAMVALPTGNGAAGLYTIETAPGASRLIALDDGTSIEMNGGTKIALKHGDNRYASLESGEATFNVRHDSAHPFELTSGKFTVRDLGTVFNVTREGAQLGVQVAEGSVMFEPNREAVTLKPGMALTIRDADNHGIISKVAAENVGGWRHRLLSFRDTPVSMVASAVERSTGAKLVVDPRLSDRPFTGTIHLTGTNDIVIPRVAALVDADLRHDREVWMLTPRSNEDQ